MVVGIQLIRIDIRITMLHQNIKHCQYAKNESMVFTSHIDQLLNRNQTYLGALVTIEHITANRKLTQQLWS